MHAIGFADESKATVVEWMPIEPKGVLVRIPKFAKHG